MQLPVFQPLQEENILYCTTANHKWYVIMWKIFSSILGIFILTFIIYSLLANPTEIFLSSFFPSSIAHGLTDTLYMGLIPLAGIAWAIEDIASVFIGEFILTDHRIWVRGSPYFWSQSETQMDDIVSLRWRRDALFIKQKSTRKIQVHMFSDAKSFAKAYEQFKGSER